MAKIKAQEKYGLKLREIRRAAGMSQQVLGDAADLQRTYISDVERGSRNVSLENIDRLAQALGKPITAFFPASKHKFPKIR